MDDGTCMWCCKRDSGGRRLLSAPICAECGKDAFLDGTAGNEKLKQCLRNGDDLEIAQAKAGMVKALSGECE